MYWELLVLVTGLMQNEFAMVGVSDDDNCHVVRGIWVAAVKEGRHEIFVAYEFEFVDQEQGIILRVIYVWGGGDFWDFVLQGRGFVHFVSDFFVVLCMGNFVCGFIIGRENEFVQVHCDCVDYSGDYCFSSVSKIDLVLVRFLFPATEEIKINLIDRLHIRWQSRLIIVSKSIELQTSGIWIIKECLSITCIASD